MRLLSVLAALALACPALTTAAWASAPRPAKPVPAALYAGRWYEIARTPNLGQRDCEATSSEFSGAPPGPLRVVQTCHKGGAYGPAETHTAQARILPGSNNARVRMSFLGGVISQEYWILDHADDNSWVIMATPGGHFVWLLARRPVMDPAVRSVALQRVRALGYDLKKVVLVQQAAPQNFAR